MINPFLSYFLISTGSFVIWMVRGFKTSFNDQMVSIRERHSEKGRLTYYLGLVFWILVLTIVNVIIFRPGKSVHYGVKTNDKGEIIELNELDQD